MSVKLLAALIWALLGATICLAQTDNVKDRNQRAPDFSGTWRLVELNGVKVSAYPKSSLANLTLQITANGSELQIERTKSIQQNLVTDRFIYYTDGRGETNQTTATGFRRTSPMRVVYTLTPSDKIDSKTVWKNGKLLTVYDAQTLSGVKETIYTNATDEWKLSKNGDKLVLVSKSRNLSNNLLKPERNEFQLGDFTANEVKSVFERVP